MSKEKSICMEHLLKEPLVDSSVRISASGSLRCKNHGNNYLDLNKIQLSSTPGNHGKFSNNIYNGQ